MARTNGNKHTAERVAAALENSHNSVLLLPAVPIPIRNAPAWAIDPTMSNPMATSTTYRMDFTRAFIATKHSVLAGRVKKTVVMGELLV